MSTHRLKGPSRGTSNRRAAAAPRPSRAQDDSSTKILVAIRRIIRATDLHSKQLMRSAGLTTPQLLVLQAADALGDVTVGRISDHVSLSQATVTTIVDRLVRANLMTRFRSARDRRVIHLRLTPLGKRTLDAAPNLLQDAFLEKLNALPGGEQARLLAALEQVAAMMDARDLDASPVLDVGPTIDTGLAPVPED